MTEQEVEPINENWAVLASWMEGLTRGEVGDLDKNVLKGVFAELNPNLESLQRSEIQKSLALFTNKDRANAMRAIWGKERYKALTDWISEYVKVYEARSGYEFKLFITVDGKRVKKPTSGALDLIGELTKYVYSDQEAEDFRQRISARVINSQLKAANPSHRKMSAIEGMKTVVRGDTNEVYRPASFPVEYPIHLLKTLHQFNYE